MKLIELVNESSRTHHLLELLLQSHHGWCYEGTTWLSYAEGTYKVSDSQVVSVCYFEEQIQEKRQKLETQLKMLEGRRLV